MLRYVLITPARNEDAFIGGTIASVASQSVRPLRWVIVSDGSTDGTDAIVRSYAQRHDWIELLRMPEHRDRQFAAKANAFNAGYERIKALDFDIVGNLDADITVEPGYFEYLLDRFEEDAALGVAGTPFVEDASRPDRHTYAHQGANLDHVSGACQLFRRQCFDAVGGYVPIKGGAIDWVAVTTARMKGWKTRTFTEKVSLHHRSIGTASHGALHARFHYGRKAYYVGGHPLWETLRGLFQMRSPPYVAGGACFLAGYAWAWATRIDRPISEELMAFHRSEQLARLKRLVKAPASGAATTTVSMRGRRVVRRAHEVDGVKLVIGGRSLRVASIFDEEWEEGERIVDPASFVAAMKSQGVRADILRFAQKIPNTTPRHRHPLVWTNLAVAECGDYDTWWKRLPPETRNMVRKAKKLGVVVDEMPFDDEFARGIKGIYDETPVRQDRKFWHYGKPLDAVKRENASYLDRSIMIGARCDGELIGFIKLVRVGAGARIMQILAKRAHAHKATTNALIAKAIEVCAGRGFTHLVYGPYTYGDNVSVRLTSFKRRNGFQKVSLPEYYVPLNVKGRLAIRMRLHLGLKNLLPGWADRRLRDARAAYYRWRFACPE